MKHKPRFQPQTDTTKVIQYLTREFQRKTIHLGKSMPVSGTALYALQVDFCHLINDIVSGYEYQTSKNVTIASDFIDSISSHAVNA